MGFPIIDEVWAGIRWLIDFFMNKTPKVVQIMFFLLFLLFFGNLINFMLQIGGVHCYSDKTPAKVGVFEVGTNVKLLRETNPDRVFTGNNMTICEAHPSKCGEERTCYYYMYELPTGAYGLCNETNSSSNCKYYLNDGSCHNCTHKETCIQENAIWIFCGTYYDICTGNAYYGGQQITDYLTKCAVTCDVPKNYVWNYTTGVYECLNLTLCGTGVVPENTAVDEILDKAGAVHLYDEETPEFSGLVKVSCNDYLNPRLTFFNVDVFNYKVWVVLLILYSMFMFLTLIRKN